MKRTLIAASMILAFAGACWADSAVTTGNMLKLRKKPASDSVALDAYPKGEKVEVLGRSENQKWLKVKILADGKIGYMAAEYISSKESVADNREEIKQGDAPVIGLRMVAPQESVAAEAKAEEKVVEKVPVKEGEGKVVTLSPAASEGDSEMQGKYDTALRELSAAQREINTLKEEVDGLKKMLAAKDRETTELKRTVAKYDRIEDVRLMSMLEAVGEEVLFTGIGMVKMLEVRGKIIIEVPGEHVGKAKKLFAKVDKHIFGGEASVYITFDKKHLNIGKG